MIIRQFETDPVLKNILRRYRDWHTPGRPGSRKNPMGSPGSGREFLQFHRSLLDEFFAWNAVHRAVEASLVTPWTAVPSELKAPELGWPHPQWAEPLADVDLALAEIRASTNTPPFGNDDELGILLERTIVNWIHGAIAAASAFGLDDREKAIITSSQDAAQSTWFYKIYGLVQNYWNRVLCPVLPFKDNNDFRGFGKDANDFKDNNDLRGFGKDANDFKDNNDFRGFGKDVNDFGKENNDFRMSGSGFKEIVDNPGGKDFKEILDTYGKQTALPSFLNNLLARIKKLEERVHFKKSPFIKPFQRPPVGRATIRSKRKKNR
jgi:hypothetical protein